MELFHKRGAKFRTHYSAYVGLIVGLIIDSVIGWQNVVGKLGQKIDWPLPRIISRIRRSPGLDG
jgi:hypothetical protein